MSMEFLDWTCLQDRKSDAYWMDRQAAEYEEQQHTPKRGLNRPETDFELNGKFIPKGK